MQSKLAQNAIRDKKKGPFNSRDICLSTPLCKRDLKVLKHNAIFFWQVDSRIFKNSTDYANYITCHLLSI